MLEVRRVRCDRLTLVEVAVAWARKAKLAKVKEVER